MHQPIEVSVVQGSGLGKGLVKGAAIFTLSKLLLFIGKLSEESPKLARRIPVELPRNIRMITVTVPPSLSFALESPFIFQRRVSIRKRLQYTNNAF